LFAVARVILLKALGGAHPRSFFLFVQKTRTKEKTPDDLPLADARGPLRFSVKTGAAELAIYDRSNSPRFSRFLPAMLGGVNGTVVR